MALAWGAPSEWASCWARSALHKQSLQVSYLGFAANSYLLRDVLNSSLQTNRMPLLRFGIVKLCVPPLPVHHGLALVKSPLASV